MISFPGFMNSRVAIKLMVGHIRQTIMDEIASVIKIGLSCGVTNRNASFVASFSTTKYYRMQAIGHMIGIS